MSSRRYAVLWALLASVTCACQASVPRAFWAGFPDNDAARTARVLSRLRTPAPAPDDDGPWAIAAVGGHDAAIVRLDPDTGAALWRRPVHSDIRPLRLGDLVLAIAGGALVALDFADGATRFELPLQSQALTGVARSGERVFVVSSAATGPGVVPHAAITAVRADDGRVLWRHDVQGALGEPAAGGDVVVVPFQQQALAVLDATDGTELARLRSTDDVFRWVRVLDGRLLAGDRSIRTIGDDYAGVHGSAPPTPLPLGRLATSPAPYPPSIQPVAVTRRSAGRISLEFELRADGPGAALANDRIYQVFYRHVIALDAGGALRWVRVMSDDIVAASSGPGGLALLTQDGRIARLAASDGTLYWAAASKLEITAAALGGDWARAGAPDTAVQPAVELRQGLLDMALDRDDRLLSTRALAIRELSTMPQPEITRDLLDIYRGISTAPELRRDVARAIVGRRTGAEFLLAALEAREDFLEGTAAPPLEVLAPALAAMGEARAYPLLARHLFDPGTPATSLQAVIEAMASLDVERARQPLWTFLRRYRADSSLAEHPGALLAAARALLGAGHAEDASALRQLTAMQDGLPALTARLAALLPASTAPEPEVDGAEPTPVGRTATATGATGATGAAATNALPPRLSRAAIHAVFADHVQDLQHCVGQRPAGKPPLTQIRIALVLSGDGSTRTRSYVPDDDALVACLDPRVARYRFGRFRAHQQTVRYVVSLRPPHGRDAAAPSDADDWWAPQQQSPTAGRPGTPWWHDRNALLIDLAPAQRPLESTSAPQPTLTPSHGPAEAPAPVANGAPPDRQTQDADGNADGQAPAGGTDAWWQPLSSPPQPDAAGSPPPGSAPP